MPSLTPSSKYTLLSTLLCDLWLLDLRFLEGKFAYSSRWGIKRAPGRWPFFYRKILLEHHTMLFLIFFAYDIPAVPYHRVNLLLRQSNLQKDTLCRQGKCSVAGKINHITILEQIWMPLFLYLLYFRSYYTFAGRRHLSPGRLPQPLKEAQPPPQLCQPHQQEDYHLQNQL